MSDDVYRELEEIAARAKTGESIEITRVWKPSELPWSCDIRIGEHGYGVGPSMRDAVEDALRDLEAHS